jgi:nuclear GTP-binding protein
MLERVPSLIHSFPKKSCKVAPIPGETKIWQYVTLFKRIALVDCPGVVVDTAGDTEEDSVLKGVVRAERLEHPEDFVNAIQRKVKREHIAAQYKIPKDAWPDVELDDGNNMNNKNSSIVLMELIARRCGRLRKGGDPCLRSAAIMLINDFQRGRLPHYVPPPELKTSDNEQQAAEQNAAKPNEPQVTQNLDKIGREHMKQDKTDDTETDDSDDNDDDESDGNDEKDDGDDEKEEDNQNDGDGKPSALKSFTEFIAEGDWDD